MNKDHQGMPFVPEEDLDLHEDFKPIIAENGIIRQKLAPDAETEVSSLNGTFTRMDTIQDLVELRSAETEANAETKAKTESKPNAEPDAQAPKNSTQSTQPAPIVPPHTESLPTLPTAEHAPVMQSVPQEVSSAPEASSENLPETLPEATAVTSSKIQTGGEREKRTFSTVSRKTIFRLRKKRIKKKKTPAAQASIPPKNPQKPPKSVQEKPQPSPKKTHRWGLVLAILCFLFLGGISGFVPVEKIPLLRELAYAMGFDKTDTAHMSFLRALLTWTDKEFGLPGFLRGEEESRAALWARLRGQTEEATGEELAGLQGRLTSSEGKTSLIDMQALQTLQRQKGRSVDEVRGSVMPIPGQEGEPAAPLRDNNVNVRTEANQDKSDVYFGSDSSQISRQSQDGYDSVNTLKKLANPYIANGQPIDWLTNTVKRMMKSDVSLGGINRGLSGMQVNWAADLNDVGEQKPHKDLYHAWITSRMSKYTSNMMLKKALADTSFLGAEIPNMASNTFGFGGIQVDVDSLQEDQEAWQEYLEFEKKCKEALAGSSSQIDKAIEEFNSIVQKGASNLGYPGNCYDARQMSEPPATFTGNATTIQQVCTNLEKGYQTLQEACKMQVHAGNIACESLAGTYTDSFDSFKQGCEVEYESHKRAWEQNWLASHPEETLPENAYDKAPDGWKKDGPEIQEVSVGNQDYSSVAIFSQIQNDSKGFATWIRADCKPDGYGGMDCEPKYPEDIDAVRGTIGDGLLKV